MIMQNMRQLEKEKMADMETFLSSGVEDSSLVVNLFSRSVEEEMIAYSKH